jgi:hypothetical protein
MSTHQLFPPALELSEHCVDVVALLRVDILRLTAFDEEGMLNPLRDHIILKFNRVALRETKLRNKHYIHVFTKTVGRKRLGRRERRKLL